LSCAAPGFRRRGPAYFGAVVAPLASVGVTADLGFRIERRPEEPELRASRARRASERSTTEVNLCSSSSFRTLSTDEKTPIRLPLTSSAWPTQTPTRRPSLSNRPPPDRPCSGILAVTRNGRSLVLSLSSNQRISTSCVFQLESLVP